MASILVPLSFRWNGPRNGLSSVDLQSNDRSHAMQSHCATPLQYDPKGNLGRVIQNQFVCMFPKIWYLKKIFGKMKRENLVSNESIRVKLSPEKDYEADVSRVSRPSSSLACQLDYEVDLSSVSPSSE